MFESVQPAPPDAILGLSEAFRADPNPQKINLTVGVYQTPAGKTPVLDVVREAERRLLDANEGKSYLPIPGSPLYATCVQELLFGVGHEANASSRAVTAHTPGGTGALRVAGDFLAQNFPGKTVWLSKPTWPNHPAVFAAAGVAAKTYPYFDAATGGLDFDALKRAIATIPAGDVCLLHGCCHNPTGVDPSPGQWQQLVGLIRDRGILPLVDFAYQGFADGIDEDAAPVRLFCQPGEELIVCSSFSKNFGLYRERVGAMTVVTADGTTADAVASQIKVTIRTNYSNPPAHGGAIVATVLGDNTLRARWVEEVDAMRTRLHDARELLVAKLREHGVPGDYAFLARQRGMFSFSGLSPEHVDTLREKYAIYIVRSGRINVAGISEDNVDRLCAAIKEVVDG